LVKVSWLSTPKQKQEDYIRILIILQKEELKYNIYLSLITAKKTFKKPAAFLEKNRILREKSEFSRY
jgi:hypothetical protein